MSANLFPSRQQSLRRLRYQFFLHQLRQTSSRWQLSEQTQVTSPRSYSLVWHLCQRCSVQCRFLGWLRWSGEYHSGSKIHHSRQEKICCSLEYGDCCIEKAPRDRFGNHFQICHASFCFPACQWATWQSSWLEHTCRRGCSNLAAHGCQKVTGYSNPSTAEALSLGGK